MTDTNTTPATTDAANEAAKPKTALDDMASRRLFDSTDDATTYLQKCAEDFTDFEGYPVAFVGATEDGDFDPDVYTDDMRVAVAKLTERGEGAKSSTIKAIVIYPSPRLAAILGVEADALPTGPALDWLTAIAEKELNHVAVRGLRKAESEDEIADAIKAMPTTVAEYITSNRETSGGILETFNALWQVIKKALGTKFKTFAVANLSKKELRKAIESASYAAAVYPKLEARQRKDGSSESYFEIAANFGIMLAKKEGLDPAFFEKALANRNERTIEVADDEDEDFDFDAMAEAMTAKDEAATDSTDTTSTDGTTTEAAPVSE